MGPRTCRAETKVSSLVKHSQSHLHATVIEGMSISGRASTKLLTDAVTVNDQGGHARDSKRAD